MATEEQPQTKLFKRADVRFYENKFPEVDEVVMVEVRFPSSFCGPSAISGKQEGHYTTCFVYAFHCTKPSA